jgi:DNA ligase-1
MKAIDFTGEFFSKPVAAEVKIDGVNGGFLNESGFTSRTGRPFANKVVTQFFSHPLLRGFNGELALGSLVDGKTCRRTTALVNSFSYNTNGEIPTLYPFDYITEQTWRFKYVDRFKLLRDLIDKLPPELAEHIKPLPAVKLCKTIEEVWEFHDMVVRLGYEGTILRDANGQHKNGRSTEREGGFMRIKDPATSEALVIELIEAEENLNPALLDPMGYTIRSSHKENKFGKGMLGSFRCLWRGKEILVSAGELTHDERREIWETKAWVGKEITFKYMPYGMKDLPRSPRFVTERKDDQ